MAAALQQEKGRKNNNNNKLSFVLCAELLQREQKSLILVKELCA